MMVILVEFFSVYYVLAVAFAAALGGVVNFILNRQWAFRSNLHVGHEAFRYFLVSAGSLAWNTLLVWFFTEHLIAAYFLSKVMVVLMVGIIWNYPLHRYWVFVKSAAKA